MRASSAGRAGRCPGRRPATTRSRTVTHIPADEQMPVLGTKLHLPTPRRQLVARPRLTDQLLVASRSMPRLVLVSAPAGFGKTTVLTLRRKDARQRHVLAAHGMRWHAPRGPRGPRVPAPLGTVARHSRLRPWERPAPPGRLTPARVRRGFRNLHPKTTHAASAPRPGKAGPGRPPGSKNRQPAPRHDVGKTVKRAETLAAHQKQKVRRQA
jgi:hypothetical protein